MTPAQVRAAIAGDDAFAPVRVSMVRLLSDVRFARLGRQLGVSTREAACSMVAVWSWCSAAWRPGSLWGELAPADVVAAIVGDPDAPEAIARVGLALELEVDGEDMLRMVKVPGGPNLRAAWNIRQQRRVAGRVSADRRRACGRS